MKSKAMTNILSTVIFSLTLVYTFSHQALAAEKQPSCNKLDADKRKSRVVTEANKALNNELSGVKASEKPFTENDIISKDCVLRAKKGLSGNKLKAYQIAKARVDGDSSENTSCNDAKKEFTEAKKEFDSKCREAKMSLTSCAKKNYECEEAIDDFNEAESNEERREAYEACGGLAKENFDKLKEDYEAKKETRDDSQQELKELEQELLDTNNAMQDELLELNKQLSETINAKSKFETERQIEFDKTKMEQKRNYDALIDRINELENEKINLKVEFDLTIEELGQGERSQMRECSKKAEERVNQNRQCILGLRAQATSTGKTSSAACKTKISSSQFLNQSGKKRTSRLQNEVDAYFAKCMGSRSTKLIQQSMASEIKSKRNRLRAEEAKVNKEIAKTLRDIDNLERNFNTIQRNMSELYIKNLQSFNTQIANLRTTISNKNMQMQKNLNLIEQKKQQKQMLILAMNEEFNSLEEHYKKTKKVSKGSSSEDGAVGTMVAAYRDTVSAAGNAADICRCRRCYNGSEPQVGDCASEASFISAHVSRHVETVELCPNEGKAPSRTQRKNNGVL